MFYTLQYVTRPPPPPPPLRRGVGGGDIECTKVMPVHDGDVPLINTVFFSWDANSHIYHRILAIYCGRILVILVY